MAYDAGNRPRYKSTAKDIVVATLVVGPTTTKEEAVPRRMLKSSDGIRKALRLPGNARHGASAADLFHGLAVDHPLIYGRTDISGYTPRL